MDRPANWKPVICSRYNGSVTRMNTPTAQLQFSYCRHTKSRYKANVCTWKIISTQNLSCAFSTLSFRYINIWPYCSHTLTTTPTHTMKDVETKAHKHTWNMHTMGTNGSTLCAYCRVLQCSHTVTYSTRDTTAHIRIQTFRHILTVLHKHLHKVCGFRSNIKILYMSTHKQAQKYFYFHILPSERI